MSNILNRELMRVGTWTPLGGQKFEVTNAMIDEIVANFAKVNSVSGYNVPIKLGHNERVGEPAYGWVSAVRNEGGVLVGDFADVDPAIVDAIAKRRYNTVSIELCPRLNYDGQTFRNVLAGVALLGAEWPAVKGLKPLSAFAAFAGTETETIELKGMTLAKDDLKFTQEGADALVLAAEQKVTAAYTVKLKEADDKVKAAEQRATLAETALASVRDDKDKAEVDGIVAAAETAGKLTPASKESAAKFAARIMKFSGKDRTEAIAEFKAFVTSVSTKVKFGEQGKAKTDDGAPGSAKAADEIDAKARKLLADDTTGKLDYEGAVKKVFASEPDLKAAYAAGE